MTTLPIDRVELHRLDIPFTMRFDHAAAGRTTCDSVLWVVDSKGSVGVGEAVFREYVSGGGDEPALLDRPADTTARLIRDRLNGTVSLESLRNLARDDATAAIDLPVLCGLETALLDLLCRVTQTDIYGLLGTPPKRRRVTYGGTLPLVSEQAATRLLSTYRSLGIGNLRIKVGPEADAALATVDLARRILGADFDLRVDANGSLTEADADRLFPGLIERGISIVEEPVGRKRELQIRLARRYPEITFAADESALTRKDIKQMHIDESFGMINIRLSKNGGLLRALELAESAKELGIRYQLGCHVGETGVLSAAGRAAASLMACPEYVDGSYDEYLLAGNVTREHVSFGPGGVASILEGRGIGFEADRPSIERWSVEHRSCV